MRSLISSFLVVSLMIACGSTAEALETGSRSAAPAITEQIDNARLVPLRGNVRQDLTAEHDLGPVEDALPLRLYIVLQRSTAQQAALENLIERQQQPTAPEYHQWLTPQQFGERFGASEQDIATISQWLESRGMHVNKVMNNASFIDFSATARDVRETFRAQMHYFEIAGGKHPALVDDPMIPAALANAVAGIQGLNKIPAHANHTNPRQGAWDALTHRWHTVAGTGDSRPKPLYVNGASGGEDDVTPQDFYTIYNVNPVFTAGTKGATATVAVIEESDIVYGTVNSTTGAATGGDVATFRGLFGVNALGTLNMHVYHGYGTVKCNDPGIDPSGNGEQGEAALDAEWASALAPAANLVFMSCDSSPNQGIVSSEMALIDNNLSDVMSLSYGRSELLFTSAEYTSQDTLYAQAATQGQTIIVSSGDSGSDVADQGTTSTATSGINVNGFSASPLVTVAGGTDFSDQYDTSESGPNPSTYWSATNTASGGSALGYVPETAWNDSCASSLLAQYFGTTPVELCSFGDIETDGFVIGGSGGFSTHYTVPSYQSGITGYTGTMRAQPDISAFAADGFWAHTLIYCDSHQAAYACDSTDHYAQSGGTSFVAPQFAGVFGLLVNYTGTRQGMLNPTLYALAKSQFTAAATATSCYSNGGSSNIGVTAGRPASSCTFNDVTTGNNDVPCWGVATGCFTQDGGAEDGLLSVTGATSLTMAYPSTPGFDEVTGIGTLNVNNLFANWSKTYTSTTTLSASPTSITSAQSTTLTATVKGGAPAGSSGTPPAVSGTVSFKAGTKALGTCTISGGSCTLSVAGSSLPAGSNSIGATFAGSKTYPASTSNSVTVTETGGTSSTLTISPTSIAFGSMALNTSSASQVVNVTNSGTSSVSISSILITGTDTALFSFINGCGSSLAASASCSVSITFDPTTAGAKSAALTITDSAAGSPQSVSLTGTGISAGAPTVSLSATSLAFGSETIGVQTAAQPVTLKNTGTTTLNITSIVLGGAVPTSFATTANTCGATLAAAASCTFSAAFKPTTTGALSATIAVTDNATGSPQSITLAGTGTSAGELLSLSTSILSFGTETVGVQTAAQIVTVKNTGTLAVTIGSIAVGGTGASSFVITAKTCGTSLAVGASCTFSAAFKPTTTGALSAAVAVTDNATGSPQSVTLSGTGSPAGTAVSLSAGSLAFGAEGLGLSTPVQTVTLKSTGTAAVSIASITLVGAGASSFEITAKTCGTTLAVGSSCTITAAFMPTETGALSAAIAIADNVAGSPQSVSLTGIGVTTSLTLSTASLNFGSENVGSNTIGLLVSVKNTSAAAITLTGVSFSGADPTSFGTLDTCNSNLAIGATCSAMISFFPQTTGVLSASLNLASSAGVGTIALSGTGIATAALSFSPSSLTFPVTTHGTQTIASAITVTNTGTTTANFGFIGIGGTDAADFYQLNNCGTSLAAGAKCNFFVIFRPAAAATYTAVLELFDNAQNQYQGVNLGGTGK